MHYDLELPKTVGFGLEGGPAWDTEVVTVNSGFEKRNKNQATPIREYRISFPARRKSRYEELLDWMEVIAQGRANSWLLKDPFDYQVTQAQGVLTFMEDESPSISYQAYKRRTVSSYYVDRKIQKLRGTVSVYDNGVIMGGGYTVHDTTGVIDITSGTGPYTWSGEFCVPVRFDVDPMSAMLIDKGRNEEYLIEWRNIPVREVRL